MQKNNEHDTLKEIYRVVGQLEGKIEVGFGNIISRLDKMNDSIAKNTTDLGDLQAEKWKTKGIVIAVGVIGGLIGAVVGFLLMYFKN